MQGKEKIAFVVRKSLDSWEGLRSTLGVLVENLYGRVWLACAAPWRDNILNGFHEIGALGPHILLSRKS